MDVDIGSVRRQASFAIRPRLRVQARRGRETAKTDSEGPCVSGIPATARRAADYRRRGPRRAWRARRVHARRGGASARARARPSVTVTAMVLLRCSMHTPGAGATRCDALWLRLRWMRLRWMRAGAEDRLAGHHAFWPRCMHGARLRTRGLRLRPGYGSRMRVKIRCVLAASSARTDGRVPPNWPTGQRRTITQYSVLSGHRRGLKIAARFSLARIPSDGSRWMSTRTDAPGLRWRTRGSHASASAAATRCGRVAFSWNVIYRLTHGHCALTRGAALSRDLDSSRPVGGRSCERETLQALSSWRGSGDSQARGPRC